MIRSPLFPLEFYTSGRRKDDYDLLFLRFAARAGDAAGRALPVAFKMASMSVGPCNGLVRNAFAPDAVLRSRTPASSKAVMTTVGIFLLMRLR